MIQKEPIPMTDQQLYLAAGLPIVANAGIVFLGFTLLRGEMVSRFENVYRRFESLEKRFDAKLSRLEKVVDARLKHLEQR